MVWFHPFNFSPFFPDSMEEASALATSVGILAKRVLGEKKFPSMFYL